MNFTRFLTLKIRLRNTIMNDLPDLKDSPIDDKTQSEYQVPLTATQVTRFQSETLTSPQWSYTGAEPLLNPTNARKRNFNLTELKNISLINGLSPFTWVGRA